MKNITTSQTQQFIKTKNNITYSSDEICPLCGRYQPDGEVCIPCQKEYNRHKSKVDVEKDKDATSRRPNRNTKRSNTTRNSSTRTSGI